MVRPAKLAILGLKLITWKAWCLVRGGEGYDLTSPSGRVVIRTCSCGACSIMAREWYHAFRMRSIAREAARMSDFLRQQGCEIEAEELGRLAEAIEEAGLVS